MTHALKYVYGPVYSWRLGISLGIDPLSCTDKICNYDCVYCPLGPSKQLTSERQTFVPTEELIREVCSFKSIPLDYLILSGRGETTLAANLGEIILALKKRRPEKIAVITNSSLLHCPDVQDDLAEADFVIAKLDAGSQETFREVNRSCAAFGFPRVVDGLRTFRRVFQGRLVLQMMFVPGNIHHAAAMADIARSINADEIVLNTPTSACVTQCFNETEMECIKSNFHGLPALTIYDRARMSVEPLDNHGSIRRHA